MEEDEIAKQCKDGILPAIPFLIEDRDETFLRSFFKNPQEYKDEQAYALGSEKYKSIPLSIADRGKILCLVREKIKSDNGSKGWWLALHRKSRANVIVFLSESFDENKVWSSRENAEIVHEICSLLSLKTEAVGTSSENLRADLSSWLEENLEECATPSESDFHCILLLMKGKFTKSEWKHFPALVHGFGWLLKQIKYPFLGFESDMVIPPALLFTDDYYDDYKILGLECLSHIIQNVDQVDLTRSNWTNVAYDAVYRLCSDKDPLVIKTVVLILTKLLKMIEKDPSQFSSEFTRYDTLLKDIIFQMEIGSDLAVKRAWFPLLDDLLKLCGLATLHWSDRLYELLRDSTVCNDAMIWNSILQVTGTIIRTTWFKINCESISEIIFRIVLNLSSTHSKSLPQNETEKVLHQAEECLKLLRHCNGFNDVESQIDKVVANEGDLLHPEFISTVKNLRASLTKG